LRYIAGPALAFCVFLLLLAVGDQVIGRFPQGDPEAVRQITRYAILIGLWLTGASLLNRLVRRFVWERIVAGAIGGPVPRLLIDLTTILIYIIAVSIIIGAVFKAPLTGFWTTSGVVGLILGFALRNVIADLFMGIAVNIDRPYTTGDWVQVHERNPEQNILGEVVEISWRTTRLRTEENNVVIIPNSVLGLMVVTNFRGPRTPSRFEAKFCLDFSVPVERARRVLLAGAKSAVERAGFVADREPQVLIDDTNELGVEYKIRYWITPWHGISPSQARDAVSSHILDFIARAGLTLAYPKEDIFYDKMPTRQLDSASDADRAELLRRVELFEALTAHELEELAAKMTRRGFTCGTDVVVAGEDGHSMLLVVEGLLEVHAPGSDDQASSRVGRVPPGEVIGEMSLLTGEPRSATVRAATDVVAYEITKEHVQDFIRRRPEIAETISDIVAERKLRTEQALAAAGAPAGDKARATIADQLLSKIKAFFAWPA
jgi:small-conductance mechanosensitive channel/CRP-like cAMP-binding protein